MPRTGKNIYKRKDGRWEARYIRCYDEKGKAKYGYIYAKTYQEAFEKQLAAMTKCRQTQTDSPKKNILYGDLLDLWLKTAGMSIKQSSLIKYQDMIEKHIRPCLGGYLVSQITTGHIEQYIQELLQNGRLDQKGGLAPKHVQDILTVIKNSFSYAVYEGYAVSCNLDRICVKQEFKEMRVFTRKEQEQLCCCLQSNPDYTNIGILICLYTGIRLGELCALRWNNISLEEGLLKVRLTMQRHRKLDQVGNKTGIFITTPKSKQSLREIPLPQFLIDLLKKQKPRQSEAFFLTGDSNKYVEPRTMQYRFQRILKKNHMEPVNFHTLRHTFATRCIEVGMDVKSVSEMLGHANVNITLNRYVHASLELKKQNIEKLTELF